MKYLMFLLLLAGCGSNPIDIVKCGVPIKVLPITDASSSDLGTYEIISGLESQQLTKYCSVVGGITQSWTGLYANIGDQYGPSGNVCGFLTMNNSTILQDVEVSASTSSWTACP